MKIKNILVIELCEAEASMLKILLGSMTDGQFKKLGIEKEDREIIYKLWDNIPDYSKEA